MIASVIMASGNNIVQETDVTPFVDALTPLLDVTPPTIYWYRPYKTSLFPTLTIDTKYFWLYSTDHGSGAQSQGGLWLGKSNTLDPRDMVEVGLLWQGNQAETPFIMYFPNNPRPIHMYYHTDTTDPDSGGMQRTKLKTTTGGDLINSTWVQETDPLGDEVDDQHLGYLKVWNVEGTLRGIHSKGVYGGSTFGRWQNSTTVDGLTFTRGAEHDTFLNVLDGRRRAPIRSWYFKLFGQWWNLGTTIPNSLTSAPQVNSQLVLFKTNTNLDITEQVKVLNYGETTRGFEFYIDGATAHIYMNNYDDPIRYSTYDLNQLQNYL